MLNIHFTIHLKPEEQATETTQATEPPTEEQTTATATRATISINGELLPFERIFSLLNSERDWQKLGPPFAGMGYHWVNLLNPDGTMNTYQDKLHKRDSKFLKELALRNPPLYQVALILFAPFVELAKEHEGLAVLNRKSGLNPEARGRLDSLSLMFESMDANRRLVFHGLESLCYQQIRSDRTEVDMICMRLWAWGQSLLNSLDGPPLQIRPNQRSQANLRDGAFPDGRYYEGRNPGYNHPWKDGPRRYKTR